MTTPSYCIVYTPLIYDLMALAETPSLTFSDIFLYMTGRQANRITETNYLDYLCFDKTRERSGLMEFSGMEFYALYYIANQIAHAMPFMKIYIADGRRKTIGEIIEQEEKKPFAVFISTLSANFPASTVTAYILNHARIPVIIGGIHVSACPDDAQTFIRDRLPFPELFSQVKGPGDSHVIGNLVKDIANGTMRPVYTGRLSIENGVWGNTNIIEPPRPSVPILKRFPILGAYMEKKVRAVMTTPYMGCPFSCNFCSISTLPKNQRTFISRDPDDFVDEIKAYQKEGANLSNRYFMFLPDNLLLGGNKLEPLLDKMINAKLKINFTTQISLEVAKQKQLLKKLRQAGATHFLIGFESLIWENLDFIGKSIATTIRKKNVSVSTYYAEQIQTIQSNGISIIGAFIFGLPFDYFNNLHDHSGKEIVQFCHQNRIGIQAACLNDLPGSINFESSQTHQTYLYGAKGTYPYLAGLTTSDLTECNRKISPSLHESPLVAVYMAYDTITRTNTTLRAAINSLALIGRTLVSPTAKARHNITEKFYDLMGLFGYMLGIMGYGEHFQQNVYSHHDIQGIFERLYEKETNDWIRTLFRDFIPAFQKNVT